LEQKKVRTIADIAQIAGVSKSTVSRALSGSSLISEETRERIQAIANQHQYQINLPASRLSKQRSNTLAFVVQCSCAKFSVEDLFSLEILGAITNAASDLDYDLLMVNLPPHKQDWVPEYFSTGRVDGFILMTSVHKTHNIRSLIEHQAPFITWGNPLPSETFNYVTSDNRRGGFLATSHLIERGHRTIAFLGGPQEELEVSERFRGYQHALGLAGIELKADLIGYADFSSEMAAEVMARLISARPDIDGVFVNSDIMAMSAMRVLHMRGYRIPEDIAVVGYDDVSLAQFATPALTTVRQNIAEVGKQLVYNLVNYLDNGITHHLTMPVELIVRSSS